MNGMEDEGPPELSAGAAFSLRAPNRVTAVGPSADQLVPLKSVQPTTPTSIKVDKRFEGFGFDDNITENGGFVFIPPDPIGTAGKSRLLAVVNTMIELRTKSGKLKWRDSLRDFFSPLGGETLGTFTFDPKVVYDHFEDRFLVVALEVTDTFFGDPANDSRILVAVSKNGKPKTPTAADWNYLAIPAKLSFFNAFLGTTADHFVDFPGFEVDEEAVYITGNMFTFVTFLPQFGGFFNIFGGMRLWIIDKGEESDGFYDGGPATFSVHDPYGAIGLPSFASTTMPALVFGKRGVGGRGSTLGTFLVSYSGLTFGGPNAPEAVLVITVDDPLGKTGGPFFIGEFVVIGDIEDVGGVFGFPSLPDAPQAGTSALIEVNDRRALDAVWRDDALWMTFTINANSGPDAGQTTAHWVKLNTSGGPGAIVLDDGGNIGGEDIAPGTFTFFPSVAVNRRGEAKFGFSASAPTIFPGAFVTGRQPDDAPGTVQGSATVHAGEDFYVRTFGGPRNRWGDYSGISVDPSNDKHFWVFNEFADQRGTVIIGEDGRWGTAWARCKFSDDAEENSQVTVPIASTLGDVPHSFALAQNYPNPFNPETKIRYQVPEANRVTLKVFNLQGQLVRTLVDEVKGPGIYSVVWDGRDAAGLSVPSGTYFYQLKAGDFQQTHRMVLLK